MKHILHTLCLGLATLVTGCSGVVRPEAGAEAHVGNVGAGLKLGFGEAQWKAEGYPLESPGVNVALTLPSLATAVIVLAAIGLVLWLVLKSKKAS